MAELEKWDSAGFFLLQAYDKILLSVEKFKKHLHLPVFK